MQARAEGNIGEILSGPEAIAHRREVAEARAGDLTPERVAADIARYQELSLIHIYLLTIARNVCTDSHRRGAIRADELPCDEVLADPSPGSGSADRLSAVRRAVRALPDEAREIVELKFDQGLTAVEIARVTGLSRFAVARRIGSALSDIREALASEEGDA